MRRCCSVSILLLPLILTATARCAAVDSLIQSLADPNPLKRSQSEMELAHLGAAARPALIDASRAADPAIASAASRVLLSLPWYSPSDPPDVQKLLLNYGNEDEQGRARIAVALLEIGPVLGTPPLVRLVMEDPSEDVCWQIDALLRYRRDPASLDLIRKLDPSNAHPAALLLSGWAWLGKDHAKALTLLDRAVESDCKRPTFDNGELQFAFLVLIKNAVAMHQYDRAAHFRRLQEGRAASTENPEPPAVDWLFVLHAMYGPLEGFRDDLQRFRGDLGNPCVLYALSKIHGDDPIESLAFAQAAGCASLSANSRLMSAIVLYDSGWISLARREAMLALANDDPAAALDRRNAHLMLARWASAADDDASVVQHLSAAMDLIHQMPADGTMVDAYGQGIDPKNVLSEIAWRSARIAQANHDSITAKKQLDQLIDLSPTDGDVVQNAYTLLKNAKRDSDAEKLFAASYAEAHREFSQEPENPAIMNEIAWLCARCDKNLPEAMQMASAAADAEPDNAAILDTFAEVNFHMNHPAESVKLETRALQLEPNDPFMQKQLQKFRNAAR
jgi:hypothetical protein